MQSSQWRGECVAAVKDGSGACLHAHVRTRVCTPCASVSESHFARRQRRLCALLCQTSVHDAGRNLPARFMTEGVTCAQACASVSASARCSKNLHFCCRPYSESAPCGCMALLSPCL
eukprot:5427611-Pleurochrysis_carterae.AAC.4